MTITEVRVVHPVRQVAAEAKCLDAPPQQPSPPTTHAASPKSSQEPSAIHSTCHPNTEQEVCKHDYNQFENK